MVQAVYQKITEHAVVFMVERGDRPIGECWLQEMNLDTVRIAFPGHSLYRINVTIGEPELWGQGLGTEIIEALVEFGFRTTRADALIAGHFRVSNVRSQRAFAKAGFRDWGPAREGSNWDGASPRHLILTRGQSTARRPPAPTDPPLDTSG